jgi:5-amino-6-(5-phosphoribosylamino)uracil reductase
VAEEDVPVSSLLAELALRGIKRVMIEGGMQLCRLFLEQRAVDEVRLAYAPVILGEQEGAPQLADDLIASSGLRLESAECCGQMSVLRYLRSSQVKEA